MRFQVSQVEVLILSLLKLVELLLMQNQKLLQTWYNGLEDQIAIKKDNPLEFSLLNWVVFHQMLMVSCKI